jgi:photosystem II stability/assembly factor-like uncharacterized protein
MLGVVFAAAVLGSITFFSTSGTKPATAATTVHALLSSQGTAPWSERDLKGTTVLTGQVPLTISTSAARYLGSHAANDVLRLNFSLALRDRSTLDQLIALEGKTHESVTRAKLYARFAPPQAQVAALQHWLMRNGFTITHTGADRLSVGASARVGTIERVLRTKINDYTHAPMTVGKIRQPAFAFFANTAAPTVPARLGIQSISGLSDVDRFYTSVQLSTGSTHPGADCTEDPDNPDAGDPTNPYCVDVRSGGYFPADLRGLYDITGHGFDGTGQTLGFTLWTAAERQPAMTSFASTTGDQLITVDANCVASGNSATTPSSCSTQTVGADHLMTILENGNLNNNWGSNVETALDIEAAHAVATHSGMKYYASECATNPPANTGLANAGCNGSDAGMEMAMEDAASDPTLRSVSNSWGYGGEAEWGVTDPFEVATGNILALAAAAGTTFYFSTGDAGTYQSGYPTDSPYVVSVGGTSTYSTSTPATWSTSVTWSGGGSWCSDIIARPVWQTGAGVTANASCPGRVSPDVSAIADPNTGVRYVDTTGTTTFSSGQVGGTSLAAPVMNGLQAVTQNYVNAQTYTGSTPPIGFVAPKLYQLGNSPNYTSYFRDIQCGNTANPTSGPDGDAAITGWDAATGWGEPDWFNFSKGIAIALGATNVSVPASLSTNFGWTCAKTPSNSTERAFSCPSASTCYAVGASSGTTPWYGKFIASGAWGAVNTIFKSTDGGQSWFPSNSDMYSIACTSTPTCMTVGAGGRERRTTDGGNTWTDVATAPGNNKPLTQIECPSGSVCYAVGDRGNVMKSTDGGQTWAWEFGATYGNPMYGLSCPDANTCYATDIYAHVFKTTDGGTTWAAQTTPITTPYTPVVAETGGPNPWGGLTGISCSDANTCVGVGIYATVTGQTNPNPDPPIVTTTNGGTTWTRQVSGAGTGNFLQAVFCLPGTTTCWAVGRAGKILTTTNLTTWTAQTSGTTNYLNSVFCTSTTFCIAVGQNGTVDVYNGSTWTATTGNGGTGTLADVVCPGGNLVCYATGKQGITILTTTGGTSWTQQAGGGSQANQLNGISCTSTSTCYAAGNAGQLLKTTNGGGMWTIPTSGTTANLNAISCFQANGCAAVGAVASSVATVRYTNDGTNWNTGSNTGTQALNGVSCLSGGSCLAVGAAGTQLTGTGGGGSWSPISPSTTQALNAVACPSSSACYAVGGAGTILKYPNTSSSPTALTSGTTQTLNGVGCLNATNCIADGTAGLITATANGTTWAAQGNPDSGPTTAQNATSITLNGALCSSARCMVGTGAQGDILISSVLTVTVNTSSAYGTTPVTTGLAANNAAISYNPSGEAGNVVGTLNCSTTATNASTPGTYPISACSGLSDPYFTVVYDYASSSHTVVKADQTIAFPALGDKTWGDADFDVSASATSGLTVTFMASGVCTVTGTTVHITGAGGCTITAQQGGSGNYNAAPDVPRSFTVNKADQTIAFAPLPDKTFGDSDFDVSASATSGLTVTFTAGGVCTATGTTVHLTSGGTCTITAHQAGDGNYNAAPDVPQSFTVNKADQTIAFAPLPDKTFGDPDFGVTASATSGLTVSFTAIGVCTVTGTTVHLTGAGGCTITAHQAGDANYNAASDVPQSFTVNKADQTIAFASLADRTWGDPDYDVTASATSGLPVSFTASGVCTITGTTVHITGTGGCTITAHQPGDANYNAAPDAPRSFTVHKADQTISFAALANKTWGDPDFTVSASATSGLTVTFMASGVCTVTGTTVHITGAGGCTITAQQGGNGNYNAAPDVQRSFTVNKADQTITFAALADKTFGDPDFTVSATASSGLAVSFSASGGCTVSGTTVHITGPGGCTITASQAGNANYNPAPSVPQTFSVLYPWSGFFQPVDNGAVLNVTQAGSAIPVKFSLGGDRGLAIFAAGYPISSKIACLTGEAQDDIEQTVNAGGSSLSYGSGQYTYVWKTDKAWSGTCRLLTVMLIDGSSHTASFKFK